nr:PREDICTED: F-BAR domain only protein 1-like [Latimeria chalumnae]|eukprot:XP_006002382.1 PREDICTED: F-BAR domain only protein 1-like [Latimeria chalumnae]
MSYFSEHFWGEKNSGFDILYHNMKHGQISTKELAEYVRERTIIEETYSKSMSKLAKIASNSSQLGTFAQMWDVFRISSDKLALCHLELMKKLHDLIKEINKYGDDQIKIHRKTKEEVSGTLEAVQTLQNTAQLLQKSKESYSSKCMESERLRKEGANQKEIDKAEAKSKKAAESFRRCVEKYNYVRADFEQKMVEAAKKFQVIEEVHLRHMKRLIKSYSHSIEDTHVQVGQVHEEFKQNVENIGIDNLIQKYAEQKGTGRERPGTVEFEECNAATFMEGIKKNRSKTFRIPGLSKKERDPDSADCPDVDLANSPGVDDEGFTLKPDINQNNEKENFYSSDSDFDDDEPRKFHIEIKPVPSKDESWSSAASVEELKATVGNLVRPPNLGGTIKRHSSRFSTPVSPVTLTDPEANIFRDGESIKSKISLSSSEPNRLQCCTVESKAEMQSLEPLFGPPLESTLEQSYYRGLPPSSPSPISTSPENVEDSGLDSPSNPVREPSPDSRPCTPQSPLTTTITFLSSSKEDPFQAAFCNFLSAKPLYRDHRPARPHSPQSYLINGTALTIKDPFLETFVRSNSGATISEDSEPWIPRPNTPHNSESSKCVFFPKSSKEDLFFQAFGSPSAFDSSSQDSRPWVPECGKQLLSSTKTLSQGSEQESTLSSASSPTASVSFAEEGFSNQELSSIPLSEANCEPPVEISSGHVGTTSQSSILIVPETIPNTELPMTHCDSANEECMLVAPPRRSKSKHLSALQVHGKNGLIKSVSPSQLLAPSPPAAGASQTEWSYSISPQGFSRGPSPVVLGSQDALPVATAFTEYISAYFRGGDHNNCIVKIVGDVTMSFPAGITRILNGSSSPPVLSFRLLNTARINQFTPNPCLLYSDLSQSDPNVKDFWLNMQALTVQLHKQAEQNPTASYYNVGLLKYQVSKDDPDLTPLKLIAHWRYEASTTEVSLKYRYNAVSMTTPAPLTNVRVLIPLEESVYNLQSKPEAFWNADEKRLLWKLADISDLSDSKDTQSLSASWQPACEPKQPHPVAVQFTSEGSTLTGVDMELVGTGYRMSLVKKRFATGKYLAGC